MHLLAIRLANHRDVLIDQLIAVVSQGLNLWRIEIFTGGSVSQVGDVVAVLQTVFVLLLQGVLLKQCLAIDLNKRNIMVIVNTQVRVHLDATRLLGPSRCLLIIFTDIVKVVDAT